MARVLMWSTTKNKNKNTHEWRLHNTSEHGRAAVRLLNSLTSDTGLSCDWRAPFRHYAAVPPPPTARTRATCRELSVARPSGVFFVHARNIFRYNNRSNFFYYNILLLIIVVVQLLCYHCRHYYHCRLDLRDIVKKGTRRFFSIKVIVIVTA